jgi:hypothetical protein
MRELNLDHLLFLLFFSANQTPVLTPPTLAQIKISLLKPGDKPLDKRGSITPQ